MSDQTIKLVVGAIYMINDDQGDHNKVDYCGENGKINSKGPWKIERLSQDCADLISDRYGNKINVMLGPARWRHYTPNDPSWNIKDTRPSTQGPSSGPTFLIGERVSAPITCKDVIAGDPENTSTYCRIYSPYTNLPVRDIRLFENKWWYKIGVSEFWFREDGLVRSECKVVEMNIGPAKTLNVPENKSPFDKQVEMISRYCNIGRESPQISYRDKARCVAAFDPYYADTTPRTWPTPIKFKKRTNNKRKLKQVNYE